MEGRAAILGSPLETRFSEPKNKAENLFVVALRGAAAAAKQHNDPGAVDQWKKLAFQFNPDDPEERKWYLLALHRAEQVENAIHNRRQLIENQLQMADEAFISGHPEQANDIRKELIEQYASYPYLNDLLSRIPTAAPVQPTPNPAPSASAPSEGSDSSQSKPSPVQTPAPDAPKAQPNAPSKPAEPAESSPAEPAKTPNSQPPQEVGQRSVSEFRS